eukprot:UN03612
MRRMHIPYFKNYMLIWTWKISKQLVKSSLDKVALKSFQDKKTLIYGEVQFWSFAHILEDYCKS